MPHDIVQSTLLQTEVDALNLVVFDIENKVFYESLVIAFEGKRRFDTTHEITVRKSGQLEFITLDDLGIAVLNQFDEPFPAVLRA